MKIEKRGIRITDLPYDMVIETHPETGNVLMWSNLFTADEARQIRDALNVALGEDSEQRWDCIEDVPKSVTVVRDKDNYPWHRQSTDGDHLFDDQPFAYLNQYAPFRRA